MSWPLPGIEPRRWQRECFNLILAWLTATGAEPALVQAVMGAGKSVVIKATSVVWSGPVVVGAPTKSVADQLAETLDCPVFHSSASAEARRLAQDSRVVVAVFDSLIGLSPKPDTLLIADEAHRADTATFRAALEHLDPARVLGFSATPAKGRKALGYWGKLLYSYRVIDALRDGVIVPWRVIPWVGEPVPVDDAARHFASLPGPPGLINARSIDDAIAFAATIDRASVVHSRMHRREIKRELARLESGELQWMVHVSILAEGFDMPKLGRYIFRSKVISPVSFAQQAGRVLRTYPGKERAIFYDPLDLFEGLGIGVGALLSGGEAPELSVDYAAMLREMGLEPPEVTKRARRPKKLKAKAFSYLQVYFRQLTVACREEVQEKEYRPGPWRKKKPSDATIDYVRGISARLEDVAMPPGHMEALRVIYRARKHWRAGEAADWIDMVKGFSKSGWTSTHTRLVPRPVELVRDLELLGLT